MQGTPLRVEVKADERSSLLAEAENLVDANAEMIEAWGEGYHGYDELRQEHDLAAHIRDALSGSPPWFIERERRDLEAFLVELRERQRMSLSLGGRTGGSGEASLHIEGESIPLDLPGWEPHPEAVTRHRSYQDDRLDTMRVCDALIKRIAES